MIETAEFCNQLPVHERHPYAGKLVHTAFSGSHQDAIRKGIEALAEANDDVWEVPYLPIDPADIGRTFEAIIRVNSQSGKAGAAYLLEADHHVRLPRKAEIEFSGIVQNEADKTGKEITSQRIWELAEEHYINPQGPFELVSFESGRASRSSEAERITATLLHNGKKVTLAPLVMDQYQLLLMLCAMNLGLVSGLLILAKTPVRLHLRLKLQPMWNWYMT